MAKAGIKFNNIRPIFDQAGDTFPEELGGNCWWHARNAANDLRSRGFNPQFLFERKGPHALVYHVDAEGEWITDHLLLPESVEIRSAINAKTMVCVQVPPKIYGEPSQMLIVPGGESDFRLGENRPNSRMLRPAMHFDLNDKVEDINSDGELLPSLGFIRSLVLQIVNEDQSISRLTMETLRTYPVLELKKIGPELGTSVQPGNQLFSKALDEFSEKFGMRGADIEEIFNIAFKLYMSSRPEVDIG